MALNIKDQLTDDLARRLAAETGESITVAVRVAMEERLERLERERRRHGRRPHLGRYIQRARARRLLDSRPVEEILGYDENGLPQ
ncbi:type II toxin-antitoxin system VapB family antitoxin [Tessaracoccus sp. MC1627]|uniref:type II toxin-antitoxin system VapB family antitoxin n=1 Tax=Tessaracoccus sp. MC1627 TaxID=2760312 RepID=UPI0016023B32|nr:type II toxin-antitoxin system VapB family antitoxin [Tessaracoccus sp. MC1627]MBB1511265.1 type II toxin-antitoxin system VapB family antitoxin [Tessaracoccus sp. MC1627]